MSGYKQTFPFPRLRIPSLPVTDPAFSSATLEIPIPGKVTISYGRDSEYITESDGTVHAYHYPDIRVHKTLPWEDGPLHLTFFPRDPERKPVRYSSPGPGEFTPEDEASLERNLSLIAGDIDAHIDEALLNEFACED